jgi:RNA polymerase sigma factor (sigma-70 family)
MINLTEQQIADAQSNDLDAVAAVSRATEERVTQLARRYATTGNVLDRDLAEDLAQVGRIAVWEALSRFQGRTVAQFFTYIDTTVSGELSSARKVEQRRGVSRAVAADFETALAHAGYDAYAAEKVAQDAEVMGKRRMSAEMAYAARLSYQGIEYLDAPVGDIDGTPNDAYTVADMVAFMAACGRDDISEDLDPERARRERIAGQVRSTLDRMGGQQRTVLMALTGIEPVPEYGSENDEELARDFDLPRDRITSIRARGRERFRTLYATTYGI